MDEGAVEISCSESEDFFAIIWSESGGPVVTGPSQSEGFGTLLVKGTVEGQLGGEIARDWLPEGLTVRPKVAKNRLF